MTGEQFYRAHRGSAFDFGMGDLPTWEALTGIQQALWDQLAYEQTLRDRRSHARLQAEKGVEYDGPYSD